MESLDTLNLFPHNFLTSYSTTNCEHSTESKSCFLLDVHFEDSSIEIYVKLRTCTENSNSAWNLVKNFGRVYIETC